MNNATNCIKAEVPRFILTEAQDRRDPSEKMKVKSEADVETLSQQVKELNRKIKDHAELEAEMETSKLENVELLNKLEDVQKQHSEVVIKLKQAEGTIEGMEKSEGVSKLLEESQQKVFKLEDKLEAVQGGRNREELERKCC